MENNIFKEGDKVFDIRFGWGVVGDLNNNFVNVAFETQNIATSYNMAQAKMLSSQNILLKDSHKKDQ